MKDFQGPGHLVTQRLTLHLRDLDFSNKGGARWGSSPQLVLICISFHSTLQGTAEFSETSDHETGIDQAGLAVMGRPTFSSVRT